MFKTHLQNAGKITYNTNAANKLFKVVALTSKICVHEEIKLIYLSPMQRYTDKTTQNFSWNPCIGDTMILKRILNTLDGRVENAIIGSGLEAVVCSCEYGIGDLGYV